MPETNPACALQRNAHIRAELARVAVTLRGDRRGLLGPRILERHARALDRRFALSTCRWVANRSGSSWLIVTPSAAAANESDLSDAREPCSRARPR